MCRVPAVPIIRNTVPQLAITGITYIRLDREMYGNVHFKVVQNWAAGCITVVELELNHGSVTNRPILDNL
jgi:hypothetical protein